MNQCKEIQALEAEQLKQSLPAFRVGDTLNVYTKIIEGEKERVQMFTGTVIARRGSGLSETVALYRVSYGAAMERVFMIHSPRITKIEVARSGQVRRAKLYYLRGVSGKAAKVKEQIGASRDEVTSEAAVESSESAT